MRYKNQILVVTSFIAIVALAQCRKDDNNPNEKDPALIAEGKNTFRFDTFGDEDFWSGLLHLDKAIAGSANGGFGPGVAPTTALAVGLKVDAEALPQSVVTGISNGSINLNDPATTIALLKLNAVVGVQGNFDAAGNFKSMGITCAVCHSTVDNSFAPGIGKRLDGWPNRDLNVGGIISLTDNAQPIANMLHVDEATLRSVLSAWGPGKFGLEGVNLTTYTGWGDISYWNSFVGNLEMHGKGTFQDSRLNDHAKYPIAVENSFYNVTNSPDLITSKLPGLRAYQHSIKAPTPPAGSFDVAAAARGKVLFTGKANCASCHAGPLLTDNSLRTGSEIGIDDFEAQRSHVTIRRFICKSKRRFLS